MGENRLVGNGKPTTETPTEARVETNGSQQTEFMNNNNEGNFINKRKEGLKLLCGD